MSDYNAKDFIDIIGQDVQVADAEGQKQSLKVVDVKEADLKNPEWQSYSIFFQSAADFHLTQGNYQISHEKFSIENFFISPKSHTDYEAIISFATEGKPKEGLAES